MGDVSAVLSGQPMSEYQREQIRMEGEKLKVEREKVTVERAKAKWTALSIVATAAGAALTLYFSQVAQAEATRHAIELQTTAAEQAFKAQLVTIAMAGTAHEAKGKLDVLRLMFPDDPALRKVASFDPNKASWGRESKNQFLSWIAAQPSPQQRKVIVDTYKAAFGEEDWRTADVERAAVSSPK